MSARRHWVRSLGGRGFNPGANHPQNNSSPNPFLRPNPPTGDFNRHERLFPLSLRGWPTLSSRIPSGMACPPQKGQISCRCRGCLVPGVVAAKKARVAEVSFPAYRPIHDRIAEQRPAITFPFVLCLWCSHG